MRSLDAGLLFAYIYPLDACGEISMCGSTQRASAAIDKLSRSQNGRGSVCVLYVRYEKRNTLIFTAGALPVICIRYTYPLPRGRSYASPS